MKLLEIKRGDRNMKISSNKITASEEIDVQSNRGYLLQCIEDGVLDKDVVIDELLAYISESDAENIINTLELEYVEEYDEY
nr:MAG TPA: hypothetical protein [Caudoviricetes sp.]